MIDPTNINSHTSPSLSGFVYLYHAVGTDFYKIGYSTQPNARKGRIQTDCPYKINPIICIPTSDGNRIEHFFHNHFRSKNRGEGLEWFELTEVEVQEFVSLAIKINFLPGFLEDDKTKHEHNKMSIEELDKLVPLLRESLDIAESLLAEKTLGKFLKNLTKGLVTREDATKAFESIKNIPKCKEITLEFLYELVEFQKSISNQV